MLLEIDAKGLHYRPLNEKIRAAVQDGVAEIELYNINGQRYIGAGLSSKVRINIHGVPGNDLGVFMDGPRIVVRGNAQDGIGNTMNDGLIVVHGDAGDVLGYAMRGGRMFVRGKVGFRVGIHMKEYRDQVPAIVVGETAGNFLGEYMAGGVLVVLGLNRRPGEPLAGQYLGTGMHGGVMYLRGGVDEYTLGKEVKVFNLEDGDEAVLEPLLRAYAGYFGCRYEEIRQEPFVKLLPVSHRPYGRLYAV
ncbi:hypothetical protein ACP3TJ_04450 [Desulforudis sp. 1088]|uniref:GltB/FmdC/FwdC-like GXGXG domain-containing protein n=1 Tax=Desulforudis sp. Tu-874 TaxID=3416276 RepID=UPI0034734E08